MQTTQPNRETASQLGRRLKSIVKGAVRGSLAQVGSYPAPLTPTSDVEGLIRRLRPQQTSRPLIRLGPNRDGGYLVPDDLDGIAACFSPGVDQESGFELDCAERSMKVFMADASVDAPAQEHAAFHFSKRFLGLVDDELHLTLDRWLQGSLPPGDDADLLLQIDIEGAEYEVFASASDAAMNRFRVIVGEFHFLDQLWNRHFFIRASSVFQKILRTHTCVHAHPNNNAQPIRLHGLEIPPLMEFTFYRKDRSSTGGGCMAYPHPLDRDNTNEAPVPLPPCWYR